MLVEPRTVWWYNKDNLCTPVSPTLGCYCWLNNSDASAAPSVYFDWVWPQHGNLMTGIKRNLNKYLLVLSLRLLAATKPPSVDNKHRHSAGAVGIMGNYWWGRETFKRSEANEIRRALQGWYPTPLFFIYHPPIFWRFYSANGLCICC